MDCYDGGNHLSTFIPASSTLLNISCYLQLQFRTGQIILIRLYKALNIVRNILRLQVKADIIINVISPILLGTILYFDICNVRITGFFRNYFPDGLWAYALVSCILIIWKREINILWLVLILLSFILFELFQFLHIFSGTGDILDIVSYSIFSIIALLFNNYLNTP